jgi:hypothetical protein
MTERPHQRTFVPRWAWLFLAGPTIWYVYFWVAYLAAEAGCTADAGEVVTWVTIGLTGATMVAIAYNAWRADRARTEGDDEDRTGTLIRAGFLMGLVFVVASMFVGVPALLLQPC